MASISPTLSIPIFVAFLFLSRPALSSDSPANPPSLPPQSPADEISPSPSTFSPTPSPSLSISSPPAPPPSDLTPKSPSPAPSPHEGGAAASKESPSLSPSPAPAVAGDISHENEPNAADLGTKEESSGGMKSGHKAAVAIGVIAGACLVGAGALVYKKRQQNIQRSQYGIAARREIL
ncbi:hypothetical protein CASFOL_026752 [Castilleja foliolosa]|uniref:Uncharacterized protein n=1 Tax=Castilleja foliolosa TaxID=1961234 RepID=A0ABD3CLA3_9LAMI